MWTRIVLKPLAAFMRLRLRLELQPSWLSFLVWAAVFAVSSAVVLDAGTSAPFGLITFILAFSVVMAAIVTATTRGMHTAVAEAVAGLDQTARSQAIAAVTDGIVPADQRVRFAAVRLGWAYLESPDEQKRRERWYWIASAGVVVVGVCNANDGAPRTCLMLVGAWAISSLEVFGRRRIQRNLAALGDTELQGARQTTDSTQFNSVVGMVLGALAGAIICIGVVFGFMVLSAPH